MLGLVGAQGRRLAAEPGLPEGRRPGRGERPDRRVGAGGRAGPARDPTPAEPRWRVVLGRRASCRGRPSGGSRTCSPSSLEDGISTFILGSDDAADDRAVRRGGRTRPARRRRGRARVGRDRDGHGPARGVPGQAAPGHRLRRRCPRRSSRPPWSPATASTPASGRRTCTRAPPGWSCDRRTPRRSRRAGVRPGAGRAVRGAQRWSRDQRPVHERRRHRHRRRRARHRRGARPRASASSGSVRAPAGATWPPRSSPHGLAISSGDYGDVGVGGLVTAGGQGFLGRSYGLTLDHVVAAELVLADGRLVRTDARARARPAVGRARRGRELRHPHGRRDRGGRGRQRRLTRRSSSTRPTPRRSSQAWAELVESSPRELTSFLSLVPARGQDPAVGYTIVVWANDDTEAAVVALERFLDLAPVLQQQAQLVPYAATVAAHHGEHTGGSAPASRGGLVEHVTPELAALLAELLAAGDADMLQLRAVGGAVNDVDPAATAYAHRTQNFSLARVRPEQPSRADRRVVGAARASPARRLPQLRDEPVPRPARRGVPARDAGPHRPAQVPLRPRPRVRRQLRGRADARR